MNAACRATTVAALLAVLMCIGIAAPAARAAAQTATTVDCTELPGLGTFAKPHELGTVRGTVIATDCPPLRSKGTKRWFRFTYATTPGSAANAATRFVHKKGRSSVDIRLADGPWTEKGSLESIPWETTQNRRGYLHWMKGLHRGPWMVGAEKITTTSFETARYDLIIVS